MAQVLTPKINLKKDDANEKIIDLRPHVNENLDILDTTVGQAVDVIANLKSLLGQLGLDENGNPVVSKDNALSTIGAAPKGTGSYSSLAAAEQAIADTNTRIDGVLSYNNTNDHLCRYNMGYGRFYYQEWQGNQQLVMDFHGNFTQDGTTYKTIQVQFNKSRKRIMVQGNKLDGTWDPWFIIEASS